MNLVQRCLPGLGNGLLLLCCIIISGCQPSGESQSKRTSETIAAPEQDLKSSEGNSDEQTIVKTGGDQEVVLAGGCFWCTEAVFEEIEGVKEVISGYAGDSKELANYGAVSSGATDHAEAIKIIYDPEVVTFGKLLQVFFEVAHDPTQKNRQGADVGKQYRSTIFYADEKQKEVAAAYIEQLEKGKFFTEPIATTLEPLESFFVAESYHQNYAKENPLDSYIRWNSLPKVKKARKKFPELIKEKETKPQK